MSYTDQELEEAVKISYSYSEVLRILGRNRTGSSNQCVQKRIKNANLDISHFKKHCIQKRNNKKIDYNEILIFDYNILNRRDAKQLRRCLIESGRQYCCEKCGLIDWNNEKIILEIDHIDGNWRNNTPENLRFLCPNCHSQTETFYNQKTNRCIECYKPIHSNSTRCNKCSSKLVGLNSRRVERPPIEQIQKDVDELGYVGTGRKYGVTDNAIRKWLELKKNKGV